MARRRSEHKDNIGSIIDSGSSISRSISNNRFDDVDNADGNCTATATAAADENYDDDTNEEHGSQNLAVVSRQHTGENSAIAAFPLFPSVNKLSGSSVGGDSSSDSTSSRSNSSSSSTSSSSRGSREQSSSDERIGVDFVGSAEAVKSLFMMPYRSNNTASSPSSNFTDYECLALHRVGGTLIFEGMSGFNDIALSAVDFLQNQGTQVRGHWPQPGIEREKSTLRHQVDATQRPPERDGNDNDNGSSGVDQHSLDQNVKERNRVESWDDDIGSSEKRERDEEAQWKKKSRNTCHQAPPGRAPQKHFGRGSIIM